MFEVRQCYKLRDIFILYLLRLCPRCVPSMYWYLNKNVQYLKMQDLGASSETRKTEDINNIFDICSEIGVEVEEVELAFRLGNQSPNKIRFLKMVMCNRQLRKAILDNAKNIRSKDQKL